MAEKTDLEKAYRGKKVMITGGLGFIGSTLAYRLVAYGARVILVDSLIPAYGGNLRNILGLEDKVAVNISDVRDRSSMNYLVQGRDCIFNLAGTLSHTESMTDPFIDLAINCTAQLSILEACRNHNRDVKLLFPGTRGQYGKVNYLPVDENHLRYPTDVNGINNNAGEWYHILYNNVHGIRACSLRLTNTFGPRHQMKHHRQGIINWFIRRLIDGETVRIFGDGAQVRDTNFVDDVVEAMLLAMASDETDGEIYNIGGTPVSLLEMVKLMIEVYGRGGYELVPYPADALKIEVGDYVADWGKFHRTTGWEPKVSLEEGLRRTFAYYEEHREHYWKRGAPEDPARGSPPWR